MSNLKDQNTSQDRISEIQLLETEAQKLVKVWEAAALKGHRKKARAIRQKYYTILERLYKELKWDEPLSVDDELPEELMPEYYLELFPHQGYYESFGTDFVEHYDNLYKKTGNEFYNLHRQRDKPDKPE